MNIVRTSAPGKLILIGEHAVVYGKPALIAAINKRCFATIKERTDNQIIISSKNYGEKITAEIDDLFKKFYKAQDEWELFTKNNEVEILKKITSSPLDYAQIIIGQFLDFINIKSIVGFDLEIDSEIPVGSGMGSSAALAVSIIGALYLFANKKLNKEEINNIAFLCEQKRHGRPSGGDNSASCFGGLILFKKGDGVKQLGLKLSAKIVDNFYVVNTGTPDESTGEMVSAVRVLFEKDELTMRNIFLKQEKLTSEFLIALETGDESKILNIIKAGQKNLEKIGVVSESAQKLIGEIEKSGGVAKICGAGGIKNRSGVILIYHNNLHALEDMLESYELEAEQLVLGAEGLRIEV